ncbi:MAG: ThiF family adenylyltransferase [Burkholderiaceae bacterium]|nr:ThiF family adenylyltransferase [Burkholderiaceae bacterium]
MKTITSKASSRPLGVAKALVGGAIDEGFVYSKSVILTGDSVVLGTANGRWCFLDSLQLLLRVVGHLTIIVPAELETLDAEVRQYCSDAWCRGSIQIIRPETPIALGFADAILSVGSEVAAELPWTTINSNGWVARVSSGPTALPADTGQANPIAALMAVSLGVTEVFKRLFGVPADRAPLLDLVEFSLFEMSSEPSSLGPPLPEDIDLPDTLLVGGGAIGNGLALLLSQLPLRGRMHIVDKEDYAEENLGTCVLVALTGWLGEPKAEKLAAWLRRHSRMEVTGEKALVADARSGSTVRSLSVDLVIDGLDNVGARHEAQSLWPSVIVDGGISEVGASVVQSRLDRPDLACLACSYDQPRDSLLNRQRRLSGLSHESLADQNRTLTEQDVAQADPTKREWLRKLLAQKRTVCSIFSEAGLAELGVDAEEGFRPSAPFVATASASMVIAEVVKALVFPEAEFAQWSAMGSLFLGPASTAKIHRRPLPTCHCVVHRAVIEALRRKRRSSCARHSSQAVVEGSGLAPLSL